MKTQPIRMTLVALTLGVAALVVLPAHADEAIDTVWLANGGRVRGSVMVDDAKVVSVKLADGKTREIARAEIMRIEYAGTAAADTKAPPHPKPKVEAEELVDEETEAAPPRKKRKRRGDRVEDVEPSQEEREAEEERQRKREKKANRLVIAGATLTSVGFAGVLVGVVFMAVRVLDGESVVAPGLIMGISGAVGVTGSVLLGVGLANRRKAQAAFILQDSKEWGVSAAFGRPELQLPPLSLTVDF